MPYFYTRRIYPYMYWKNKTISKNTPIYVMNYDTPRDNDATIPFNPSRVNPLKIRRKTLRMTIDPASPYYNKSYSRFDTTIKQLETPNGYTISTTTTTTTNSDSGGVGDTNSVSNNCNEHLGENVKDINNNPNSNSCAAPCSTIQNSVHRVRNRYPVSVGGAIHPTPKNKQVNSYTMKYRQLHQKCSEPVNENKLNQFGRRQTSSHRTYTLRNSVLLKARNR